MRFALWLLACGLALGVLLSACGSGERDAEREQSVSTGTVRSERAEREASIMQQEEQRGEIPATSAGMTEEGGAGVAEQGEAGMMEGEGESSAASAGTMEQGGVIDFGHREGLPFTRNVVGDPEAPVLIVEYSDFQ